MVFGVDGTEKKNDKYDFNRAFQTFIQKSNKPQFIVTSISGYTLPQTIPTNKECSNMCVDAHNHVNHPQSDLGEKQFQCSMCPKRYKYKDSLNKHYITHGKKPYNCVICSESFTRRSNFIEHNMIIHTGEKKFVCKVCSKSFYVLGRLRQHEKVHSDEEKRYETVHLKDSQFQQTEFHTQEQSFSNDLSTSSCTVTQIESSDGDNRNIIEENIKAGLNTQEKNVKDDLNSQEDLKNEFNIYEENIKIEFTSHDVEDENITSDVKPPLELISGDSQQITENETVTWETDQEITNTGNTYDKTNGVQDLQTEQDVDITLDIKPFKLIPGLNSQQITEIDKTISEDKNKKVHTEEMLFSEISEEIPFNSKMYSDTFNTEKKLKKCENNIQPQENQFFNELSTNCFEAVLNKTSDEDESNLVDVKNDSNVEDNIDIHEENIKVDFTNRDARDIELQQVAEVDIATLSKEIEAVVTSTNISNDTNYLNKECSENLVADNNCVQPRKTNEKEKRIHSQTKQFHCKTCFKSFHTNNQLVRHERVHTGERPFVCKICSHSFKELSHLKTHQRIHSGEKPFVCKICSHSFKQVSHLKSHQQIHSGEKPFVCKICSHSCRRLSDLKTHQWVHSIEKPFVCEICSHSFKRPSHLKTHQQVHSGEKPFVCKFCSKSFVRKLYLRDHERIHTEKPYSCQYCSKIFRLSKYFKVHLKTHLEKEKKYCCEICTKSFYSKKGLKNHQKTIHEGEKLFSIDLSTNQYKSISIENSDEKYFNIDEVVIKDDLNIHEKDVEDDSNVQKVIKDHLKIHEENIKVEVVSKDAGYEDVTLDVKSFDHLAGIELQQVAEVDIATVSKEIEAVVMSTNISNDTNYLNKDCSENSVADNNCVQPGKTDEREKQFHCRICSKNYKSKALLQKHGKIHSQTKQFHCKICLKSFRNNNQLVGHERVHTGERPFVCKICPHSFKQLSHLKTHQQVHSGEKPFVCKICSKAFADKFYLRDHERIHTEKRFSCQYCPKTFHLSKSFKKHLKIHLEKKLYFCEICTKLFFSMNGFKKHQKTIHKGEKLFSMDPSKNQCKPILVENLDEKYFNIYEEVIEDDLNIHEKDVKDDSNVQEVIKDDLKIHEENEYKSKDVGDEKVTLDVKSNYSRESNLKLVTEDIEINPAFFK